LDTVSLSCNNCGAALTLPESARFVTCSYCKTQLEVKREGGAAFTEIREAVANIERDVADLKHDSRVRALRDELASIDSDWDDRRTALMEKSKDGYVVPTEGGAIFLFALSIVLPVGIVVASGGPAHMILLSIAIFLGMGGFGLYYRERARRYEAAYASYRARRDDAESELAVAQSGSKKASRRASQDEDDS